MAGAPIRFEPLVREDFGLLARWLEEPLVAYWWSHETSPDALERDFGPAIDRREPTEIFLAGLDRPYGLVQRYLVAAYPEYLRELDAVCPVRPGALSIDYLIGEPQLRGKGLGGAMISDFLDATWATYPAATAVIVPVCVGNEASWRALERAGLRRIAAGELQPDNPREPRDHFIYEVTRP